MGSDNCLLNVPVLMSAFRRPARWSIRKTDLRMAVGRERGPIVQEGRWDGSCEWGGVTVTAVLAIFHKKDHDPVQ